MRLIIFDIDGTLANTDYEKDLCYAEAFQEVTGHSLEGLDFLSCKHVTDSAITDHFFQQLHQRNALVEEVEALKLRFREKLEDRYKTHPQYFEEIPGASATFNSLLLLPDVHLGIATGAWRYPALFKLEVIGIPGNDVPFVGADKSYSKIDSIQEVIELAQKQHGNHSYKQVMYVGDRVYDWQVSNELGIDFVGVDFLGTGVLAKAGAEIVLPNLMHFPLAKLVG
jgi:phosphoglycolate phosphatase-like HAD superfamily hydrolase